MRLLLAASLTGLALVSLAACNKSAPSAGNTSAAVAPSVGGPAGPLTVDQIPHRKAGLWSQTMAMEGGPAGPGAMQICVDDASEARSTVAAQNIPGAKCATPQFTRNLDGSISFAESCDMGTTGKIQTSGTIKGDFSSSYTVTMSSTTTGSSMAAMNGVHNMTMTGAYVGPCGPGQKGGDIIMANGMTIHPDAPTSGPQTTN
jgi:hypothetical protein